MHFGLSPLQSGGDFDATIAECERAEAAGFDSVWLCVQQIERFQTELGMTHLICRMSVAGIPAEAARASMDLFTREVMPALKDARR